MTSASKVAFIAGFDLFLTPIFSLFMPANKHNAKPTATVWFAVCLSIVGLFFLSDLTLDDLQLGRGEMLTLISTVFWTMHITFTDMATSHIDSLHMMIVQLWMVTFISTIAALVLEPQTWFLHHIMMFMPWLLFLAMTEGMAFTLMALGQSFAPPTHAAIILSLEGVFAAVASYFYLGEHLTPWELFGCSLMLIATLCAEVGCPCLDKSKAAHVSSGGLITASIIEKDKELPTTIADDVKSLCATVVNAVGCLVMMPYSRVRDCCRRYKRGGSVVPDMELTLTPSKGPNQA